MKVNLFFADKFQLTQTEYRDKKALQLLELLHGRGEYLKITPNRPIKGLHISAALRVGDGSKLRELVLYARTNLKRLATLSPQHHYERYAIVANAHGYWVSDDPAEIRTYRDSLHVRAVHGLMAVQGMNEILNENDYSDERAE